MKTIAIFINQNDSGFSFKFFRNYELSPSSDWKRKF